MVVIPAAIPWFLAVALMPLDGRRPWVGWLAVTGLAANLLAVAWLGAVVADQGTLETMAGSWPAGVGITLRADALGLLFAGLANAVLLAALLYQVLGGVVSRTFPALVLFSAAGLTGLFLTADAFNFYVFFEISMTAAFVLASYGESPRQMRSSLIFVVVNLLGSVFFLAAIAGLYHVTGTLDMREVARRVPLVHPNALAQIGATFLAAFGLKLGLFPFSSWLPPVYRDSDPAVAAIFSGALANIGSYGLLRFGGEVLPGSLQAGAGLLLVMGAASILYGALLALSRFPTREVLAYSAIGQAGYILIALAIGGPLGYGAAITYTFLNSLNKTVLFLAAGARGWLVGTAFAVGAFSVAGLPPAAGFLGKAAVFWAGLEAGNVALVVLIFLGGALSLVYMFRIYQREFWSREVARLPASPVAVRLLVLLLAATVVGLGLWPEPLLLASARAAAVLPGGMP
ncbi:MAG: complex I subunit 5 family protein [Chloroflexota bacterium]